MFSTLAKLVGLVAAAVAALEWVPYTGGIRVREGNWVVCGSGEGGFGGNVTVRGSDRRLVAMDDRGLLAETN